MEENRAEHQVVQRDPIDQVVDRFFPIAGCVDCLLDSHDEGVEKPDPRYFDIALERSGARRETTIHVGDLYHVDVVGARNAGLRGVLLDEAGLYPDADCPRVSSLTEFVDLVCTGAFD